MDLTKLIKDAGAEGKPHSNMNTSLAASIDKLASHAKSPKWTPNPNVPQHATHLGFTLMCHFQGNTLSQWTFWKTDDVGTFDPETDFSNAVTLLEEHRLDFPQLEWKLVAVIEVSR